MLSKEPAYTAKTFQRDQQFGRAIFLDVGQGAKPVGLLHCDQSH